MPLTRHAIPIANSNHCNLTSITNNRTSNGQCQTQINIDNASLISDIREITVEGSIVGILELQSNETATDAATLGAQPSIQGSTRFFMNASGSSN
jgi:hypothetical protein